MWWPTLWGWAILFALVVGSVALWVFKAEDFLSATRRVPADVLVVEGWIGPEAVRDAALEFKAGGYRFVVATGGLTGRGWSDRRWSYAEGAQAELSRVGIPAPAIILAPASEVESQRTHEMAVVTAQALRNAGIEPRGMNVFTRSTHARRSRLVYAKAFKGVPVGVISWLPPGYHSLAWWNSSFRAQELLKESVAYLLEMTISSGRGFRAKPAADTRPQ